MKMRAIGLAQAAGSRATILALALLLQSCGKPSHESNDSNDVRSIADSGHSLTQRREFAVLATRGLGNCKTLSSFAKSLNTPTWVAPSYIAETTILAGWIPIDLDNTDTSIPIVVLPKDAETTFGSFKTKGQVASQHS